MDYALLIPLGHLLTFFSRNFFQKSAHFSAASLQNMVFRGFISEPLSQIKS